MTQPTMTTQPTQRPAYVPPVPLSSVPATAPMSGFPGGPVPPVNAPGGRRVSWPGVVALILVVLLLGVTAFQAYQVNRLGNELDETRARAAADVSAADKRVEAVEKQLATQFNAEKIAAKTLPSVFRVRTPESIGSAFAVGTASDGGTNLLTNFHVIEDVWNDGTKKVKIEHADQLYDATVVAGDKKADIAQLHTTAKIEGLKVAATESKSGQEILVVGSPLGLKDTVTSGVVSAFREETTQHGPYIQFDAPINPGNSGGPVINANYEVIGIASAKFTDAEGLGLAIPIKIACDKFTIC
ncbi:S1C family serine protease [Hamadaea flava]|nr:trypsin-like peptidase domain-containing protein [Hamadaea flava]